MLKYGIFGAGGKMGCKLVEASAKFINDAKLINCFTGQKELLEKGGLFCKFSLKLAEELDVVIDFSTPQATLKLATELQNTKVIIVCGTTGFSPKEMEELKKLALGVKILYSPNFSLGVNKFFKAVKILAKMLEGYDVEILEKHHKNKQDAPSGTALELGKIIAIEQGLEFEKVKTIERNHKRAKNEIGFASIRQGLIAGFHEVSFANEDERIWLGHEAFNKNIFAEGAISSAILACTKLKNSQNKLFTLEEII